MTRSSFTVSRRRFNSFCKRCSYCPYTGLLQAVSGFCLPFLRSPGWTALCAPAYPSHSVLSLCRQLPTFSAFFMPSSFLYDYSGLYWFRPSLEFFPQGTMASADFCAFSTAFLYGRGYAFRRIPPRPPRVPHVSFPPSTCRIYHMRFRAAIGLRLGLQPYPRM